MVFPDVGGGEEEVLRMTLVVDANALVIGIKAGQEEVEKLKKQLRELKDETGATFRAIGDQMKKQFVALPDMSKTDYGNLVSRAIKEIKDEDAALVKQRLSGIQQTITAEQHLAAIRQDEARAATQGKILDQKQQALILTKQEADALQVKQAKTEQELILLKEIDRLDREAAVRRTQGKEADISQQMASQRYLETEAVKATEREIQQKVVLTKAEEQATVTASRNAVKERERELQQQILFRRYLEQTSKGGFLGFLQSLGTVGKFVFGSILGVTAITALRSLVRYFGEAAEAGYDFAKSMFQLEVGVRALQRAGMDITLKQMYDQLRTLRDEFGIFAFKDLVKGSAQFTNLIRDLGFTKDQFFELQESVAVLATVNGRAMDEVQRTVALALSSGYTEGLQRLGVSINRVTIAQEAANLGWRNGYTALTEIQRAEATYNLIQRKTAIYQKDLLEYQKSAPGKIDTLKAKTADYTALVGTGLIPVLGMLAGYLNRAFTFFIRLEESIRSGEKPFQRFVAAIVTFINPVKDLIVFVEGLRVSFDALFTAITTKDMKKAISEWVIGMKAAFQSVQPLATGAEGGILGGDITQTDAAKAEKQMEQITTAVSNNIDDIEDIIEDGATRRIEIDEQLARDLEEISRDSLRRREEIERDYQRKIADIERDTARDIAEANRKHAQDLADLARDETRDEEELRRKQREKELEDEKKFQEKMRKLRADFLFDLEEAVRARDAVQIRRLQRRFEFERNELIIERNQEKKQRQDDFKREIEDLRRQAAEKRRELAIQFAQKLEDIALQRQQELADAALKHQQDLEDLRRQEEEKRKDRLLAYRQELEDLNRQQSDRLRKIAEALAQEVNLTAQGAQAVYDVLKAYFGPSGAIDQLFQYYIQAIGNVSTSTNKALSGIGSGGYAGLSQDEKNAGGYAYGGSFIADRPTTARFGERMGVPELVTVTPLMGKRNTAPSGGGMYGQAMNGNLSVMIRLSPGLEGEIIERTLSEFEGLLASLERSR